MSVEGWLIVASAGLFAVLVAGIVLVRRREPRREHLEQLGRPLIAGSLVGLALVPFQLAAQQYLRERDEANQRSSAEAGRHRDLLQQIAFSRDLRSIDLRGEELRGVYLRGKDLRGARLAGADLRGAILDQADLRDADLSGAHFDDAYLRGARLEGASIRATSFAHADLTGAHLRLSKTALSSEETSSALDPEAPRFDYADMANSDLRGAKLNASFRGASLIDARLNRAQLVGSDLSGAALNGATARRTGLCSTNLSGAYLQSADFRQASFIDANLSKATLGPNTDFRGADFRRADLRGARVAARRGLPGPKGLSWGGALIAPWLDPYRAARFDSHTQNADLLRKVSAWSYSRATDEASVDECDVADAARPLHRHRPPRRPRGLWVGGSMQVGEPRQAGDPRAVGPR
jgi:uncharacterized protein YjbI with pentapeptide repeats